MESDRKALRTSLTSEVLGKKEEVATALLPHYEALIQRSCDRVARIPIDINWESFVKAKRPDLALSTLHLWGSYFVLHRIASVIDEICTSATPTSPLATRGHPSSSLSATPPASPSTPSPPSSMPLYPGGKSIIASKLVRIIVKNEDKPLHGKDKVVLKPYLRKKHNNDKEKAEDEEEVEDEEVWVLTLRGNFGQGALGGFSRKRLISTLTRRLKLTALHHKALLDHVILPRCNAQLLALAGGDSTDDRPKATSDDNNDGLVRGRSGVVAVQVAIDWETIDECDDERALRNLAAWGGHYSLAQVALAFTELAERWKTAECVSAVVQRVVVRHVPGQDATRKRCFVEDGVLYIDGVWELDGWQAGFRHHQIAEVLKQTHYLATCPHRGKKKFKYLKRALQSTNVLNGHVDYLKWILSQPCFQQPDQALTNAINTCLQPYVTKGEEYIHGWHCIKVNFRGQAQERIVVLTDCAVYTFAYDFAKNKIDNDRVHRHVHEHFKHITYGKYMNAAGGQAEYCLRYETHERVKKDKDAKSGGRSLGNVVAKAESAAALNQKVLGLVELMVDEQLSPHNEATPAAADNSEAGLGREVDTGVKGFTCRRLLKLLGETILKYHDNYRLDLAHLLPGPAVGLIDGLGLVAAILEDHQHALFEGLVHATGEPHLQGQVKLDNSPATTLHFVLKSLLAQLKALLVKRTADGRDETDSSEASLHNFTLAPPTSSSTSSSSAASSVHILFFVSQLLKQMQRIERIEQVELMGAMTASASKRRTSRENSHVDHDATSASGGDTSAAPAKKAVTAKRPRTGTVLGPAANNRRMFHLPTPEPLPVSRVLQRIGEHLRSLALAPFRFPSSSAQLFAPSSSTTSSSSLSSPSPSATPSSSPSAASSSSSSPSPTSPVDLADVCLSAEELIEAVVKALIDKPIPAVEFPDLRSRKMISVLERCVEPLLRLDLPPFQHTAVDQLLGLAKPKSKANKPPSSSSPSASSPSAGSSSPSFFRKFIPEEPDTWVLLLKPAADIDDPDARQDLVKEMGWAIYGAARTALRPWWAPKPERRGLTAPSSFFAQVYNKTGQGKSNRPSTTTTTTTSAAAHSSSSFSPSSLPSSSSSSSSSLGGGTSSAPAMVTRDSSLIASPPASQHTFAISPAMVAAAVDRRRSMPSSSSSSSPSASPE